MPYHLYRRSAQGGLWALPLSSGLKLEIWRPTLRQPLHRSLRPQPFLGWSLFHFTRIFTSRDFAVVMVFHGSTLIHHTCLLPAHFRFPFMAHADLQVAGVWTAPPWRGKSLALAVMAIILQRLVGPNRILWYLTLEENTSSIRLAEKSGFTLYGQVQRNSSWMGIRPLGRFLLSARYD